ncbi:Hypothetical protein KVN_LOCUS129 [uncultured virus]|nr:Hypothetical protein KVN_LOCUS129 [uncultured virus]
MDILIAKSLFCPNDYYLNVTIESIKNLIKLIDEIHFFKYKLLFIGWSKDPKIMGKIEEISNKYSMVFDIWKINYGKYHIFNKMKKYLGTSKYVLYLDHDILFENNLNLFSNLVKIIDLSIKDKQIGLIALNQKNDNRHKMEIFEHKFILEEFRLLYSNNCYSVALGCFFTKSVYLESVSELDEISVYGLDDYNLSNAFMEKGFLVVVAQDISVIHPFDKNQKYINWKLKTVKNLLDSNNEFYYWKTIEESINLWND